LDPGGDACELVTGLSRSILSRYLRRRIEVRHTSCEALKHDICRWAVSESGALVSRG
jgi:predicted hydrocarbon binding protein